MLQFLHERTFFTAGRQQFLKPMSKNYTVSDDYEEFNNLTRRLYRGDPYFMGREEKYTGTSKIFSVSDEEGSVARCIAIINPEISYKGLKTGMIGFFESFDDIDAVKKLFEEAVKYFKEEGVEYIVGPMNGSIWNNFKITVPNDKYPEFFLENYHKNYYGKLFESFGFKPIKRYISTLYPDIKKDYSKVEKFEKYFKNKGITVRKFEMENFEEDLKKVYNICLEAFKNFELFCPISFEHFALRYIGVKPLINPEYFLIAELDGQPCAFIFAINNLFESIHFTYRRTLIIRHLASNTKIAPKGLGTFLAQRMHMHACKMGFDEIIHSMMDCDVTSYITYSKGSEIIREYNLYGLDIR